MLADAVPGREGDVTESRFSLLASHISRSRSISASIASKPAEGPLGELADLCAPWEANDGMSRELDGLACATPSSASASMDCLIPDDGKVRGEPPEFRAGDGGGRSCPGAASALAAWCGGGDCDVEERGMGGYAALDLAHSSPPVSLAG